VGPASQFPDARTTAEISPDKSRGRQALGWHDTCVLRQLQPTARQCTDMPLDMNRTSHRPKLDWRNQKVWLAKSIGVRRIIYSEKKKKTSDYNANVHDSECISTNTLSGRTA
jgi:hypothetical protein